MAFPVIPFLVSVFTNIPQIIKVIGLWRPMKKAIVSAEAALVDKEAKDCKKGNTATTKEGQREFKHQRALDYLWDKYGSRITKYGLTKHEIDITLKFMVIVVKKFKSLGRYRRGS